MQPNQSQSWIQNPGSLTGRTVYQSCKGNPNMIGHVTSSEPCNNSSLDKMSPCNLTEFFQAGNKNVQKRVVNQEKLQYNGLICTWGVYIKILLKLGTREI